MRSGYDTEGGEDDVSTGYSRNEVFKIAPKKLFTPHFRFPRISPQHRKLQFRENTLTSVNQ